MATNNSNSSFHSPSLFTSPLTFDQLFDVLPLLRRCCGFPQRRWHELGLRLGLHKNTLDAIKRIHPDNPARCLTECLSKWLLRVDSVDNEGGATFDSLSNALKSMNENAAADKLDQERLIQKTLKATPPKKTPKSRSISLQSREHPPLSIVKKPRSISLTTQPPPIPYQPSKSPPIAPKPRRKPSLTAQLPPIVPIGLASETTPKPHQLCPTAELSQIAPKPHQPSLTTLLPPIKQCQSQVSSSAPLPQLDPTATVLHVKEEKKDSSSLKPMKGLMSPEYITMKEMLGDLVDLLAGNAPVISQLNIHLFSSDFIPKAVYVTVGTTGLNPYDRANKMFSSVLAKLECHSNPINSMFCSLIVSLQKVGLNDMAFKLIENLRVKGGHVDPNLEQQPSVSKGPLQPVDVTAQSHISQPTITPSQSSTLTTVIELSSKSEVATNIKSLHSHFASLNSKLRDEFDELVEKGKVNLKAVARSAAAYLTIDATSLKYGNVDELFYSLQPYYNFFSCGVLKHLTDSYLLNARTELTQYIDSVDKFSKLSQLKHIRSTIEEKLLLPAGASPTTRSDLAKPTFMIKLNDRWEEITFTNFKKVLNYYFGDKVADNCIIGDIGSGCVAITLLVPNSLSQSLLDATNKKTNSMSRLGILKVAVGKDTIPFEKEDDNNFDISLHKSVQAGDSFEVSLLLQLGADPNSKDERGKSAVEIASEGGHTEVKEILLTAGGEETGDVKWGSYDVSLTKPSTSQCLEVISQLNDSHQNINLWHSTPDIVQLLISQLLNIKTIKELNIYNTKITRDVILVLSHKIKNNTSLQKLWISDDSINDDGVIALAQSLFSNKTITDLYLSNNPDVTSTSAQSLAELLLYNHTLSVLNLHNTNIDTDGVLVLVKSLATNKSLWKLYLDSKHEQTCHKTMGHRLYFM